MSFTKLEFTKDWTNPEDFPTFEDSEEQVRSDMQLLFDECRDGVNRLAGEINAERVPFKRTAGIDAVTVQNALEVLYAQIAGVTLGEVPDASIGAVKLAAGAVTEPKLAKAAVTEEKIANRAVSTKKLADCAVETEKIAAGAVTGEKIADGALTLEKFAEGALDGKADLDGRGKVLPEQASRAIVHVVSSRTLALEDAGRRLNVNNDVEIRLLIPLNSQVPFPLGTEIELFRAGEGEVLLEGSEDVTLLSAGERLSIPQRYGCVRLKKMAVNTWAVEDAAGSVGTEKLADAAVTAGKLDRGAVETEKIPDRAVTYEKTSGVQKQHSTLAVVLTTAGWGSSNTQSVEAQGVTSENTVIVTPAPKSWTSCRDFGIRCTAQGEDTLAFQAENKPTVDVTVNVLILAGPIPEPEEEEDEDDAAADAEMSGEGGA